MKKLTYFVFMLFAFITANAQILDPAKWTSKVEKKSDTEYVLIFDAVIEEHWHVYSQFTADGGVLPLEVLFNNDKGNYEPVGKAEESETITSFNDVFGVDETYFNEKAQLRQTIKVTNPENTIIQVELSYQACKEVCIQQNKLFEINLKTLATKEVQNFEEVAVASPNNDKGEGAKGTSEKEEDKRGLLTIFLLAFAGGLTALLTPCVFPMIPMTVSFFTKQSKNRAAGIRNAIFYGISIIIIYVILGSVVTAIFGADSLNALSTNVWFNLAFFVLLIVFAASFLGAFEIMLPNSWANKIDKQADRGGFIGILFMALALAIVSFSCTGPIVGTLLVEAASKGGIAPIIGMLGFSSALALPFMLFAMFPGWLNSLPKSGGWLNTVKVFLGFLELAFAFKFLSNADLVLQLHILERETFLAIWIAVFGVMALYLFGKITLPHDSPLKAISVGRLFLGLLVLSFTVYLIPGLWGAPLKLISGFPPPASYSESPFGFGGANAMGSDQELPDGAKLGAHNIIAFEDYEEGLAYAKEINKPVLIDFTGYACVNCRKMEDYVWSDERILSILKNDVVLISLYVDYKKELSESEQYISETTGKKIKTIGNKWSDFQITRYKANAQPYYVLINLEEENLNDPIGYTPDIEEYETWLKSGIENF
ncbi:thiol:disulfide interchange protein [Flavobacterium salilacus subsp. salilacus]|uniref:protein-disulfide reductase DsbD family protein n=1 Tax=Flavobacterium TaxID=237 RepID=UPI0010757DED|nr:MULTISPECIES: thioredoxin family protein [Flavobacterium]KAF2518781.1 thiol:disulfide interchange protein [Flavobacterium salilacus subsp. salilacus]MBE1613749.1 thioredoxin family protein [Flavobacterium sp. SaA2.13]